MIPETIVRRNRNGAQTYRRIAIEQCTRTDGRETRFIVWESACRTCGKLFYVTSGSSKTAIAKKPGIVHCPEHRARTTEAARARDAAFAERYSLSGAPP